MRSIAGVARLILVGVAGCALAHGSVAQNGVEARPPSPGGATVQAHAQAVVSIDLAMPAPLDVSAAVRWGELLGWDEATRIAVARHIREFLDERRADLDSAVAPVVELVAGFEHGSQYRDPAAVESLRSIFRARNRAVSALEFREEVLFRRLADTEVLPSDDVEAARQLRRRDRFEDYPCATRQAALNLRRVRALLEQDAPLEIDEEAAWDAAWLAHDHELAELHERRLRAKFDAGAADAESFHRAAGDMQAFMADRSIRFRSRLRVERSIRAANDRWTAAFAQALVPESAQRFREAVDAALFPELSPDRFTLLPLLESMTLADGVTPELANQTRSMLEQEISLVRAREAEVKRVLVEVEEFEALAIVDQGRRARRATAIEGLWALRREAAARAVAALEDVPSLNESEAAQRLRALLEPARTEADTSQDARR